MILHIKQKASGVPKNFFIQFHCLPHLHFPTCLLTDLSSPLSRPSPSGHTQIPLSPISTDSDTTSILRNPSEATLIFKAFPNLPEERDTPSSEYLQSFFTVWGCISFFLLTCLFMHVFFPLYYQILSFLKEKERVYLHSYVNMSFARTHLINIC